MRTMTSPIDLVHYRLITDVFQGFIDSDKLQVFSSTKLSRVASRVTIMLAFTRLRKHKEEPITMNLLHLKTPEIMCLLEKCYEINKINI